MNNYYLKSSQLRDLPDSRQTPHKIASYQLFLINQFVVTEASTNIILLFFSHYKDRKTYTFLILTSPEIPC